MGWTGPRPITTCTWPTRRPAAGQGPAARRGGGHRPVPRARRRPCRGSCRGRDRHRDRPGPLRHRPGCRGLSALRGEPDVDVALSGPPLDERRQVRRRRRPRCSPTWCAPTVTTTGLVAGDSDEVEAHQGAGPGASVHGVVQGVARPTCCAPRCVSSTRPPSSPSMTWPAAMPSTCCASPRRPPRCCRCHAPRSQLRCAVVVASDGSTNEPPRSKRRCAPPARTHLAAVAAAMGASVAANVAVHRRDGRPDRSLSRGALLGF